MAIPVTNEDLVPGELFVVQRMKKASRVKSKFMAHKTTNITCTRKR